MLDLVFKIIDVTDGVGIPLGFYTSQWFSNWYLQGLDHFIKEELRVKYYMRYMDDMVLFGSNKHALHRSRKMIEAYLEERLGLCLKGNWQVFLFDYHGRGRDLDFMGFRFFRNRVVLRRSILLKASRKARKLFRKEKITIFDVRQMLSYFGWLGCTDTYEAYQKWIKPYVSFRRLRKYLSYRSQFEEANIIRRLTAPYLPRRESVKWNQSLRLLKAQ